MARLKITDLEIERRDDPFEVEMADGTVFTFKDPKAIQFSGLLLFDPRFPARSLRAILGDDEFDAFAARDDVDGYFLEAVFARYAAHYGILPAGEATA
jgi:hypothetical protein